MSHHKFANLMPQVRLGLNSSVIALGESWRMQTINQQMEFIEVCGPGKDASTISWTTDLVYWMNAPWESIAALSIILSIQGGQ